MAGMMAREAAFAGFRRNLKSSSARFSNPTFRILSSRAWLRTIQNVGIVPISRSDRPEATE